MALFRFQNRTIKNKLIMISMFTSGVALVVTLVAILSGAFYATRSATLENISSIARVIGTNCEAALTFDDPDAANKTLKALAAEPQIDCSRIYREDGSLFAQYHRDNDNKAHADKAAHSAYSEIQAVLDGRSGSGSHRFEANSLKVLVPIVLDRNMIGVVEVSSDLRALYRRLTTVTFDLSGHPASLFPCRLCGLHHGPAHHLRPDHHTHPNHEPGLAQQGLFDPCGDRQL